MANSKIGRLERVPLREVWKHEAYDFTQWLENNIDVLNESLELSLANPVREQAAGTFSIDLVAEDENGNTVIIENQLEKSDHDHLGKLLTYLTAMGAKTAIWIVSDPRPEHVTAISWLNESSSAQFYMIKVEAVRIGDSPAAPLFTKIVGPSEEISSIGQTKKELAERHILRQNWWSELLKRAISVNKLHANISAGTSSYISASSGIRGLNLVYAVVQKECYAELYIDKGKDSDDENKAIFDQLFLRKDEIEKAFGYSLSWERLEGKRASRIRYISTAGGYRSPEEEWPNIQNNLIQIMDRFEKALRPFLAKIKTSGDVISIRA